MDAFSSLMSGFSAALTAAANVVGPIIPPSITFLMISVLTNLSASPAALAAFVDRTAGRLAVFSASRNCAAVLAAAGIDDVFAVRMDGMLAEELGLPGKPDPATLLETARRLGVRPGRAVVVEDSGAGVTAARAGGFGLVIAVDRGGDSPDRLAAARLPR
jgi:HAD superfamily hydrolase (TIGR01509 family)